jgi:endonuclease YncB( thermonuclease family)
VVVWKAVLMKLKNISLIAIIYIAIQSYITPAYAKNTWSGIVTYVTDGDTLRIQPISSNGKSDSRKIRIDGIDAPESCQLYGVKSTAALKKLLISKKVTVHSKRFDDYGREVAKITVDNVDVGTWMVQNGHAWSYHYRFSAGPYRLEEEAAIRAKLGLFADATAVEPKIFRREHGSCYPPKNDHKRDK